jgi:5-methyltetrahydrofolate--homocysteine methyltransferase
LKHKLEDIIQQKILILDGAMGTMIQNYNLQEKDYSGERFKEHPILQKGNNDLLSITKPEIIKGIHSQYLEAGADIITTNTFNSNKISMSDYAMEKQVYDMNFQSAHLAAEAIIEFENSDEPQEHFVAGTLGPTNRTASIRR